MKNINIIGKNLEAEDIKGVKSYIEDERRKHSVKNIEGEYKKTREDIALIELANNFLNKELKEIGLNEINISLNQIHLFPHDNFVKFFPEEETEAFYKALEDVVCIDADSINNKFKLFKIILHESLHFCSFDKYHLDNKTNKVKTYRTGYRNVNPNEKEHEHYFGFNEAITEKITVAIIKKYQNVIIEKLDITQAKIDEELEIKLDYHDYIEVLDIVAEKIAEEKKIKKDEVWNKFIKGYFTGEMMHLRDIEKIGGKGSLRLMSALITNMNDLPHEELIDNMKMFFNLDSGSEKDEIAKKLLNKEEYIKYKK